MKTLFVALTISSVLLAQDAFRVKVAGRGQPMILIPGLSSSGEVWDSTVARYREGFECHVLTVRDSWACRGCRRRCWTASATASPRTSLARPVLVGHSLGGFLALAVSARYPELAGKLVIVDAYPFFGGIYGADVTAEHAKANAAQMRQYMGQQSQEAYERYTKSGVATQSMVTKESDLDRVIAWGLASDRTAVTDAMVELFTADLRDDLARIKSPALVLGTWIGYKEYTERQRTEANLRRQYAKLAGVDIRITDTARHFIMWDDPDWMFAQMDPFLGVSER